MSLETYKRLSNEFVEIRNFASGKAAELEPRLNAINPNSPDAREQYDQITAEWTALKNEFNPKFSEYAQKLNAEFQTLTDPAEIEEAREERIVRNRDNKATNNDFIRLRDLLRETERQIDAGTNTTNKDASAENTENKLENSSTVAPSTADTSNVDSQTSYDTGNNNTVGQGTNSLGRTIPLPVGAMPPKPNPVNVTFKNMAGEQQPQDMRVKIRVPKNYLTLYTKGPGNKDGVLGEFGGIIFPYQPSISYEHKAEYNMQTPLHSNYTQYFYKNSQVTPINISGKFSVSNENEAIVYIATVHLLRSLTKMRFGGSTGDADSGAPPPVCRLDAYGTFMLQNVPVVINSFKIDLTENMDFYTLGKRSGSLANTLYEKTAVPILSTISIGLLPVYSRDEIQKFNVTQWLNEKYVRKAGYL